ncbi:transmembrane receptor [Brachionus plicatilis]|uniref:Transmembrane receptor n=1 Tax=Brachionus plicatilis TaxID=10195 RepID=A0A3M7R1S0_BRAPC|nr:transmembrane receptor [Brachionus plicatilis]
MSIEKGVLNLNNQCICEGFYDGLEKIDESNCNQLSTKIKNTEYDVILLIADYNEMEIKCPKTAFVGFEFNCSVTIKKPSRKTLAIDFGSNNKSLVINTDKFPFNFQVSYTSPGHYLLKVNVQNHKMNVQTTIYVYDDNNSILTEDKEKEFIFKEKGIYLGCFYDQNYFNTKNEEIKSLIEKNMTQELCFNECKEANYQYAILKNSFECYCSNKYGMDGISNEFECNCVCQGTTEDYCGCLNNYKVFGLENKRSDTVYAASYEGCFNLNYGADANFISYNTNGMCLRRCRDSQYFLTFKKNFCMCTDSLEEFHQMSENKCDLPCPGNFSQICGSFLASSVYKIKSTKLEISCPDFVELDGKLNCTIELLSNATIEIDIKLQDKIQKMTLTPNSNNSFTRNLSFSSVYEFEISSTNSSLLIFPSIFGNKSSNIRTKTPLEKIEIFEKSEYIGCLKFVKTDKKNNENSLNYKNCSEYCSLRHFQYFTLTNNKNLWCECASNIIGGNDENIKNCLCSHEKLKNFFSSCLNKFKIHKSSIKNSVIFYANYMGCFKTDKKSDMITLGFLNNHLCIQYCVYNKFKYAASSRRTNCLCSNEIIVQDKIEDKFCSLPCNGNQSQFCGGLAAKSVYEIKELRMIIECPETVVQFENLICSIEISFKYQNSTFIKVSMDFGDKTSQHFDIYTDALLKINKTYNRTGNFRLIANISDTPLHVMAIVKVEPNFEELNIKKEGYIGCFFDRNPFEFNEIRFISRFKMKNSLCSDICNLYDECFFNYFDRNECSCSDRFGKYNEVFDLQCSTLCSGNKTDLCGGEVSKPYTIFNSNKESVGYYTKIECTTVNISEFSMSSILIDKNKHPCEICAHKSKSVAIVSEKNLYCSEHNYNVVGLDYSLAKCDKTCTSDNEIYECGGSQYFLRSVYNVNKKRVFFNINDFYFEYLGCFDLNSSNDLLIIANSSIINCFKFCQYFNYTLIASGESCFCLNNINRSLMTEETQCSNQKLFDMHHSGQNHFYAVYEAKIYDQNLLPKLKSSITHQKKQSVYSHRIITAALESEEACHSFCYHKKFSSFAFDQSYCYCSEFTEIIDSKQKFLFLNNEPAKLVKIMNEVSYDISGCLINCSNKGVCTFKNDRYKCDCDNENYGSSCEKTNNPCDQKNQCLNNGTCIFIKNEKLNFRCECSSNFYGSHCENAIDLCENVTCSGNEYCQEDENKVPKCKCFKYYKGDKCEEIEPALQTINTVIRTSTIIAAVIARNEAAVTSYIVSQ